MRFIDLPHFVETSEYEAACQSIVKTLSNSEDSISIYQIGGVSSPGISDLDVLVVFRDEASCSTDPRERLSQTGNYLFTHNLFATTVSRFDDARRLTFFHNYRLLHGRAFDSTDDLPAPEATLLKKQIALEYLVRMFISLSVEISYGVLKVRNLLLHAKALLYDCEFLSLEKGSFYETVQTVVARRNSWFSQDQPLKGLRSEVSNLHRELETLLSNLLPSVQLYLPPKTEFRLARHLRVHQSDRFNWSRSGFVPPPALASVAGHKFVKIANRLNRFEFAIPFSSSNFPSIISRAFDLRARMQAEVRSRFPHFMPLSTSLNFL